MIGHTLGRIQFIWDESFFQTRVFEKAPCFQVKIIRGDVLIFLEEI